MTPEIESLAQHLIEAADRGLRAHPEDVKAVILAFREELAELKCYQLNYEHATKLERQAHAEELKQATISLSEQHHAASQLADAVVNMDEKLKRARRDALGACLAAVSELDATERAQGVIVSLMEQP